MAIISKYKLNGNANASVWNNLTTSNVTWVNWKVWGAWSFNGNNSNITWTFSFDVWTNWTISVFCFINFRTLTTIKTIAFKWTSWISFNWNLSVSQNWALLFWNTSNLYQISNNWEITIEKWYYIWFTTSWWTTIWYINWVQKNTVAFWTTSNSSNTIRIWNFSNWTLAVDWLIDEVEIHNTALTPAEIKNKYLYYNWFM